MTPCCRRSGTTGWIRCGRRHVDAMAGLAATGRALTTSSKGLDSFEPAAALNEDDG
eukprot:COSAG01_NODE_85_length_27670_cov_34.051467_6_plen_56_part_00